MQGLVVVLDMLQHVQHKDQIEWRIGLAATVEGRDLNLERRRPSASKVASGFKSLDLAEPAEILEEEAVAQPTSRIRRQGRCRSMRPIQPRSQERGNATTSGCPKVLDSGLHTRGSRGRRPCQEEAFKRQNRLGRNVSRGDRSASNGVPWPGEFPDVDFCRRYRSAVVRHRLAAERASGRGILLDSGGQPASTVTHIQSPSAVARADLCGIRAFDLPTHHQPGRHDRAKQAEIGPGDAGGGCVELRHPEEEQDRSDDQAVTGGHRRPTPR